MSNVAVIEYNGQTLLKTSTGNLSITPAGTLTLKNHVIGTDVQAQNAKLQDLADSNPSTNHIVYWDGSNINFKAENSAEATTVSNPLTLTGSEVGLSLDSGNLEVNGSNELAIKAGGVSGTELAGDCIDSSKIADDAVGSEHLQDNCVGNSALANDAVSGDNIVDDVVLVAPVMSNPKPSGEENFTSSDANSYAIRVCKHQQTTDATETALALHTLADGEYATVDLFVIAKDTTATEKASYKASFCCSRDGASSTRDSTANVQVIHEDDASWNIDCDVNGSHEIVVGCTGDASNTVDWCVYASIVRTL